MANKKEYKAVFYSRVNGKLEAKVEVILATSKSKATGYARDYAKANDCRFVNIEDEV